MTDSRLLTLLGTTLRRERERNELTQRALAARAGVTQSAVANIELGTRTPSVSMLERLFAALDVQLTIGVEPLDAQLDAAIAELAAAPVADRVAATDIHKVMDSLTGIPYVFDGPTAALLQGAPVPAPAVHVALRWADAEPFTGWLERNYGRRWHEQWQQFGYLRLEPQEPGAHRWRTLRGEVRARFGDELPAAIEVRLGDRTYPVVPLVDVEIEDPHAESLLRRYRLTRGRPAVGRRGREASS